MNAGATGKSGPRGGRYLFFIGLLLLSILAWHFGVERLLELVRGAKPAPLLIMAGLIVLGFWIRALKWHLVLGRGQQGVLLFFLAKTAGNWTPGRAGELAPLLLRRHRHARVAAWIALDRAVEVAWTLGLGALGAVAIGILPLGITLAIGALCVAVGCVAGLFWLRGPRGEQGEAPLGVATGWRARLYRAAVELWRELLLFAPKLPLVMFTTALAKLTDIYAVILLCEAFGYGASFLVVCAARCAHGLVSAVPVTPDATGVPFVAAAWLLHNQEQIPYDTLTAALGLEVLVINAILWACFCLVSGIQWKSTPNGPDSS